jgi:hypothetical protein
MIHDPVPAIRHLRDFLWGTLSGDVQVGAQGDEVVCKGAAGYFAAVGAVAEGLCVGWLGLLRGN